MTKYKVTWDTTDAEHPNGEDPPDLPDIVEVPSSIDSDFVADWISDKYGFFVYDLEEVERVPTAKRKRKPVDPEVIRKRTDKALLALRKSAIIAGQQGWFTSEQSSILGDHVLHIEEMFRAALPPPEAESDSRAVLPF